MALSSKPSGSVFSGDLIVPVILGEYGANPATQTTSRLFWLESGPILVPRDGDLAWPEPGLAAKRGAR